jgi:hypothetical protein
MAALPLHQQQIFGDQVARALDHLQRIVTIAGYGQHARSALLLGKPDRWGGRRHHSERGDLRAHAG